MISAGPPLFLSSIHTKMAFSFFRILLSLNAPLYVFTHNKEF